MWQSDKGERVDCVEQLENVDSSDCDKKVTAITKGKVNTTVVSVKSCGANNERWR